MKTELLNGIFSVIDETELGLMNNEYLNALETLYREQKNKIMETLPENQRNAFLALEDLECALIAARKDNDIVIGMYTAVKLNNILQNPFHTFAEARGGQKRAWEVEKETIKDIEKSLKQCRKS